MTKQEFTREVARLAQRELDATLVCPQGPTMEQVQNAYAKFYGSWECYRKQVQKLYGEYHG